MKNKQHYSLCVVIPFRFGEQEIPNKNLQKIHNIQIFKRSLIHATYLQKHSNLRICLSTNNPKDILKVEFLNRVFDERIIREITKSDIKLSNIGIDVHNRSEHLARKNSPINLTIKKVRKQYMKKGVTFDYWLLLQPTSPFRSTEDFAYILREVSRYKSVKKESLISVKQVVESHPARMYSAKNSRLSPLLNNQNDVYKRRQALKKVYIRDGGFYLFSDKLAVKGKLFSRNPYYFVRKFPWTINIDTLQDLNLAKSIQKKAVNHDPNNHFSYKRFK
jgi:CMP-N-acetylneuraminic acid synthetase